jgi:hypothetical protein
MSFFCVAAAALMFVFRLKVEYQLESCFCVQQTLRPERYI